MHIFVLIDALGWKILEGREFLPSWLPYRQPLRTVLGYSSGAIPTILTGAPPSETGHWNLFYYDPEGSPFRWLRRFRWLPRPLLNHRVTRKLLKEMGRRMLGLGPLFECCVSPDLLPWFNWTEKRNIYERGGITGARSVFDLLADRGLPYHVYSYHDGADTELLARARGDVARFRSGFFFIYLSQMDGFLHTYCGNASKVAERTAWYEAALDTLFVAARAADPDARLTVFSDHGMTPVLHHYDLKKDVDRLGLRTPQDYLAVYDSTMARFWFDRGGAARQPILDCLNESACGRVLGDGELRQLGICFPDSRYGELVFLLHPGWLLAESDFNGDCWKPAGMHGYHPDDEHSDAVFLSSEAPARPVRTIADVFGCMCGSVSQ